MAAKWPNGHQPSVGNNLPGFIPSKSTLEYSPYTVGLNLTPGLSNRMTHDQQLSRFFGQPKKSIEYDPEADYDKEHLDLPDAYEGKSTKLRKIMIDMISEAELYPIRTMFPMEEHSGSMTIQWDIWRFNHHQLNRQPEESVPRLLSFNREQGQESFVRYGIGLMLEHGFYKTPMGRECYLMNLQQIRNATVETLAYGAMHAAVNHQKYRDRNDLYRQTATRDKNALDRIFFEERNHWAQSQKSMYGLQLAEKKLSDIMMNRNGHDADFLVVPKGIFTTMPFRDENRLFFMNGKSGGPPSEASIKSQYFNGKRIEESRTFRMPDHRPGDDPCFRYRSIGGWFHMVGAHLRDVESKDYKTQMMDTIIFSRAKDNYHRLYYADTARYSGLYNWDSNDMLVSDNIGRPYFNKERVRTYGDYARKAGALDRVAHAIHEWGKKPGKKDKQKEFLMRFGNGIDPEMYKKKPVVAVAQPVASQPPKQRGSAADADIGAGVEYDQSFTGPSADELKAFNTEDILERWNRTRGDVVSGYTYRHLYALGRVLNNKEKNSPIKRLDKILNSKMRYQNLYSNASIVEKGALSNRVVFKPWNLVQHLDSKTQELMTNKTAFMYAFGYIVYGILELDSDYAISNAHTQANTHVYGQDVMYLTNLELEINKTELLVQSPSAVEADKLTGLNALAGSAKTLRMKDEVSPTLILPQAGTERMGLSVVVSNFNGDPVNTAKLAFQSLSVTLSSYYCLLFHFDDRDVKQLLLRPMESYRVVIDEKSDAVRLHPRRRSYLQFNASLSAIHAIIRNRVKNGLLSTEHTVPAAEKLKELTDIVVSKIATSCDGVSADEYKGYIQSANMTRRPLMAAQWQLHNVISMCVNVAQSVIDDDITVPQPLDEPMDQAEKDRREQNNQRYDVIRQLVLQIAKEIYTEMTTFFERRPPMGLNIPPEQRGVLAGGVGFEESKTVAREQMDDFQRMLILKSPDERARLIQEAEKDVRDFSGDFQKLVTTEKMKSEADFLKNDMNESANKRKFPVLNKKDLQLIALQARLDAAGDDTLLVNIKRHLFIVLRSLYEARTAADKSGTVLYLAEQFKIPKVAREPQLDPILTDAGADASKVKDDKSIWSQYTQDVYKRVGTLLEVSEQNRLAGLKVSAQSFDGGHIPPGGVMEQQERSLIDRRKLYPEFLIQMLAYRFGNYMKSDVLAEKMTSSDNVGKIVAELKPYFNHQSFSKPGWYYPLLQELVDHVNARGVPGFTVDGAVKMLLTLVVVRMGTLWFNPLENFDTTGEMADLKVAVDCVNRGQCSFKVVGSSSAANAAQFGSAPQAQPSVSASSLDDDSDWLGIPLNDIRRILYTISIESGCFWKYSIDNNIPVVFGLLGFRPHKTFDMGTLVYMNAGKAGRTWWAHADFMLADDAARKMHYGNFTLYAKTVVMFNQYICLFPDIYCRDYVSGDGHDIWDPLNDEHVEDYHSGENMRDIFIVAVPINFDVTRSTYKDITGRFVDSLCVDEHTQNLAAYDTADIYRNLWGWRHFNQPNTDNMAVGQPKANTVVFQEQQFLFNPVSGRFDLKIADAGHWGDENIYEGCTRVLKGAEAMFRGASAAASVKGNSSGPFDIFSISAMRPVNL